MLREILELNRRAAERGDFEVAYHLLMAALHFADGEKDHGVLDELGRLGREQGEALERVRPRIRSRATRRSCAARRRSSTPSPRTSRRCACGC